MGFLRTLFWIALTVVVLVFSLHNWTSVTVSLFGGMVADVKLPVLLVASFLLGFLPLYGWHRFQRWQHRRRLAAIERGAIVVPAQNGAPPPGAAPEPMLEEMP